MLDHILKTARTFKNTHGTSPDIVYINPYHYEGLCKQHPELFASTQDAHLGFRLVIVPSCRLHHPEAAMSATRRFSQVA